MQTLSVAGSGVGPQMFQGLTFDNYTALQDSGVSLWTYTANSAIVALGTTALTTVVATLAGYGLARLRFPGAGAVFVLLLVPFMVPFQGILTPLFTLMNTLGLTDNLIGLVFVYTTFQLPFAIFVMRNAFSTVPKELEETGMIDGLSTFGILRTLLPMVTPGMATVALYAFIFAWNDFLAALILITSQNSFTLPVALVNIQSGQFGQVDFGVLSAGATVATIPCLIAFLLLQRYYVNGLSAGAVKG
ncbi:MULTISPECIES: carbohydrate ABC transporter permease [Cryobacterium]|uniref:carbohydrate ABC transporter permease n=1 Tax=Cryobacterium TaxID=69578 RepID=UPI0018E0B902|nr:MULTISPECIES: carbohydrate ABC transporter permease [Cryobacterium]